MSAGTSAGIRGATLQRSFAHDMWHIAELNEALGRAGLAQVDVWS